MLDAVKEKAKLALVIDDDPSITSFFVAHLKKMGFSDVVGTLTVRDGLDLLEEGMDPALIICDLNMPDEDGFDFLSYAAQTELATPIVVCSGSGDHLRRSLDNMLNASVKNFVCTLGKPVDMFDLAEAVLKAQNLLTKKTFFDDGEPPAIEDILNGVDAYFQPKYCGKTLRMQSAEVLARVRLEDGTTVFPGVFIPLIKNSSYSNLFTLKIIRKAATYASQLQGEKRDLPVAINIGIQDLRSETFFEDVTEIVRSCGISPGRICFEITEDEIYENDLDVMICMGRLVIEGFTFSLDDFGTGFSNFERLKNLPISELKLDRLFIDRLDVEISSRNMVSAFIEIARSLALKTVAEGVETREQMDILRALGADSLQGYYLATPQPFDAFRALPVSIEVGKG